MAILPGGGIYARVDVTLSNSTVSGNRTTGGYAVGGGIAVFRNLTITNSTVSGNSTAMLNASGGGIWHDSGVFVINNSIVAGNTAAGGMNDIRQGGGSFDVTFSLIEQIGLTFTGGDNILGQSANLGPLANNGGPTETHALLAGSPAIDAGDPSAIAGVGDIPEFDQRGNGFGRVSNGQIDIGAIEVQIPTMFDCDFDNDGTCDIGDIDFLIAEIASSTHSPAFDLTGDGLVDLDDRDQWLADAGADNLPSGNPYLLGDANLDGVVDTSDFNIWNNNKFTNVAAWSAGDFNADGVVDTSDFNIWNNQKFTSSDGALRRFLAVSGTSQAGHMTARALGANNTYGRSVDQVMVEWLDRWSLYRDHDDP